MFIRRTTSILAALVLAGACLGPVAAAAGATPPPVSAPSTGQGVSLETAASRAGSTARKVALSMIGLALAVASVVLCFKRDFKEAVGVLAVGIIAVLLASPAGVSTLQGTVSLLFG